MLLRLGGNTFSFLKNKAASLYKIQRRGLLEVFYLFDNILCVFV
jgi:hypothetical protein